MGAAFKKFAAAAAASSCTALRCSFKQRGQPCGSSHRGPLVQSHRRTRRTEPPHTRANLVPSCIRHQVVSPTDRLRKVHSLLKFVARWKWTNNPAVSADCAVLPAPDQIAKETAASQHQARRPQPSGPAVASSSNARSSSSSRSSSGRSSSSMHNIRASWR